MTTKKRVFLSVIISKLFPDEYDFESEIKKIKYYNALYNSFPEIKMMIAHKNYWEKEMPILKLILDSMANILKQSDGPLFEIYRNKFIRKCIMFYKNLYKNDKQAQNTEDQLTKKINKTILKGIVHMPGSGSYTRGVKKKLKLSHSSKQIIKFYKNEKKIYDDYSHLFGQE